MTGLRTFRDIGILGVMLIATVVLLAIPANADDMRTTKDTLLDRIQIEDLMIDYYWDLTSENRHDINKYWAKDAEFVVNGESIKGREAIQKVYDTRTNENIAPGSKFNMLLNNPRIVVKGGTAVMDAIWTGIQSDNVRSAPRLIEQGSEHTEFVKQDGRWLIIKRTLVSHGGMPDSYDGNPND